MLTKLLAILFPLLFSVCAMAAGNTVLVDYAHMQMGDKTSKKPSYAVTASPEIILDLGTYKFFLWSKDEPQPDTVSVVIADNQQYYLKLQPGKKRYALSQSSLTPRKGSLPFHEFMPGQQLTIAIGRLNIDNTKKEEIMQVHWLGLVDVKPSIAELTFDGPESKVCEKLHYTSGIGSSRKEAKEMVVNKVIKAGGNAVVYTGGATQLNKETRKPETFTESALIYLCPNE